MAFTAPVTRATDFLVTATIWNAEHVDNFNTAVLPLRVRKGSDQSVTSSTVLVNDSALVMAVAANEIWQVRFCLVFSALQGAELKVAFTFPASGEIGLNGQYHDGNQYNKNAFDGTTSGSPTHSFQGGASASNKEFVVIKGVYINAGTAGNLQLQFAQNVSNGTATIMRANSTLWAVKLA